VIPPGIEALLDSSEHPAGALTAREQQVMEMLARGLTNREIAEHLQISIKTVDTHRGHVLKKLGLRNNSELTRFAVKHGYVAL
jgi:DNA-binding NarL/FixJ family response regulator